MVNLCRELYRIAEEDTRGLEIYMGRSGRAQPYETLR